MKFLRRMIIHFKLAKQKKALRESQATLYKHGESIVEYDKKMTAHRKTMHSEINSLYEKLDRFENKEAMIYLVLLYFSSIGAKMVEKAEEWLTSWGDEFTRQGFREIGEDYIHHAKEEVGHDQWHKNDVKALAKMFEEKFGHKIDVQEILKKGNTPCVAHYTELSENTVSKEKVYLSLAELFETEIMALDLAPDFIAYCVAEAGFEVLKGLGFLKGHVAADVDHIEDNVIQMSAFLKERPETVDDLVSTGKETIEIYTAYFNELFDLAQGHYKSLYDEQGAAQQHEKQAA